MAGIGQAGGSLIAALAGLKGSKPVVPDWTPVDPTAEQTAAIKGNQQNLPGAENLASNLNTFNQQQILGMLKNSIPGFDNILGQTSKTLQSQLRGEIPTDVSRAVSDNAASRSFGVGTSGSGFSRNLTARDLGTTSLAITNNAISSSERWLSGVASMTMPQLANPSSMFITPQQRIDAAFKNNANQWNVNWLQNQVKAMPSPVEQAEAGGLEAFGSLLDSVGSSYLGGMMGGMGSPGGTPASGAADANSGGGGWGWGGSAGGAGGANAAGGATSFNNLWGSMV